MQPFEQDLRNFVISNFLFGQNTLNNDDSFLENGIIDSTGILELVAFVEEKYEIRIEDSELIPENLDSISRLVTFLSAKVPGAQAQTASASTASGALA